MTKQEAIEAMKQGNKLTHTYFTDEEWVKSDQRGIVYILEDGVECSSYEFWRCRTDESYNEGLEIFYPETSSGQAN